MLCRSNYTKLMSHIKKRLILHMCQQLSTSHYFLVESQTIHMVLAFVQSTIELLRRGSDCRGISRLLNSVKVQLEYVQN